MKQSSRREFLGKTAAGALFAATPFNIMSSQVYAAPSDKLNIAGIGVGGMGNSNLGKLYDENIVALCDVDFNYAKRTVEQFPKAKLYKDYREMLEKEKNLDAVVIATPDHTHAVISTAAMKAGKHVYCQKPLTHDVREARVMKEVAKETGAITQMGIQGHSSKDVRRTIELIQAGVIGEVREVDTWCSLSYFPYGHESWSSPLSTLPEEKPPIPDYLDWDLWLGPAANRPYHPTYHPRSWRAWWDFGCGMLGDRGCHTLDCVFWALNLGHPLTADASSFGANEDTHSISSVVRWTFPERGNLPPVTVNWYEGLRPPRPEGFPDGEVMGDSEGGVIFKGTKGFIMGGTYGGRMRIFPEELREAADAVPETIHRVPDSHEQDWTRAIKTGKRAGADFDFSGPLTEMVLLGNVAKKMDTRIDWDGDSLKVTNLPEANDWIARPYREGWKL